MTHPRQTLSLAVLALLLAASIASAHPGHGAQGLMTGLEHPVTGLDHVLAMVGVGMLAVGLRRFWVWALPATFVGSMIFGAALGTAGLFVPSWLAETGIALSVFTFGLLITLGIPLPAAGVTALTALFALCHGSAHAAEMPAGGSTIAFFAGFTLSTIVLHAVGIGVGVFVGRRGPSLTMRACGGAMGVCGVLMLFGIL